MQEQPGSPLVPPTEQTLPSVESQHVVSTEPTESLAPSTSESRPPATTPSSVTVIEWQASEYITREKNTLWFVVLGVIAVVFAALALFLIKDITFTVLIVVMAVTGGLFCRRPALDFSDPLRD